MCPYTDDFLAKELPKRKGTQPFYRLRWRLEYSDGKKTRYGGWNAASQDPKQMAAFVDKDHLAKAVIEGERFGQWTIKPLVVVDGHNFASFEWRVALTAPSFLGRSKIASYTGAGDVIGMSIITRDSKITVFVDGQIQTRPLDKYETLHKLEEHTRGAGR